MKSVRFSEVVERSGHPQVHALWVAPDHDPEFLRARKANRVMTIESRGHGKADVGVIGFDSNHERGSQILIFPKSLKPFEGRQVVGVKFDLVEQPATESAGNPAEWRPPAKKHRGGRRAPVWPVAPSASPMPHKTNAGRRGDSEAHPPRPDAPKREARDTRKAPPREPRRKTIATKGHPMLLREVRAALEELREGKAVAAYQRLERAARDAEAGG